MFLRGVRQKKALDLFTGTKSVANRLIDHGYDVVTLDVNKNCKPHIVADIMTWDYTEYPPGHFELIAASVPCNEYSCAKKTVRDMESADQVVLRTLEIIHYLKPKHWWIENPKTGYLKKRGILDDYLFLDVDYCQFTDWGYQKPTRFWGSPSIVKKPHVKCDFWHCANLIQGPHGRLRHWSRLGGSELRYSTRQKGRIPAGVIDYLLGRSPQNKTCGVNIHEKYPISGFCTLNGEKNVHSSQVTCNIPPPRYHRGRGAPS